MIDPTQLAHLRDTLPYFDTVEDGVAANIEGFNFIVMAQGRYSVYSRVGTWAFTFYPWQTIGA